MKNINFELKYIYMLVNFDIYFYIYIIKMDLIVINVL